MASFDTKEGPRSIRVIFQIRCLPEGLSNFFFQDLLLGKKTDVVTAEPDHPKIIEGALQVLVGVENANGFRDVDILWLLSVFSVAATALSRSILFSIAAARGCALIWLNPTPPDWITCGVEKLIKDIID